MMGGDEARTLLNLKACRALTDESIEAHHGRVFGSAGDSVIAEFASPVDAIVAAVEFQRNLRDRNAAVPPEDRHFRCWAMVYWFASAASVAAVEARLPRGRPCRLELP